MNHSRLLIRDFLVQGKPGLHALDVGVLQPEVPVLPEPRGLDHLVEEQLPGCLGTPKEASKTAFSAGQWVDSLRMPDLT